MKVQIEHVDLLLPRPALALREGYRDLRIQIWLGRIPLGVVMARPRGRMLSPERLGRLVARRLHDDLLRVLVEESLRAGPALAGCLTKLTEPFSWLWSKQQRIAYVRRALLGPAGLPEPVRAMLRAAAQAPPPCAPPVTVVVCTRDRPEHLRSCLDALRQLVYPAFEILIVDNSAAPAATRRLCQEYGVRFAHAPEPGLSRARNVALRLARHNLLAFTDDDCAVAPDWLRHLVAPLEDPRCASVTGLVLPARLENDAEIAFEEYGGLTRGYVPQIYGQWFFSASRLHPPHTWRIGAGANMLIRRDVSVALGGYDDDLGPGRPAGVGEDTDLWYAMLRAGNTIHYAPRAVVYHYHRATPQALRRQLQAYATGHTAYHWRCLWRWRDPRALTHLIHDLPRWQWMRWRRAGRKNSRFERSLFRREIGPSLAGPFVYTATKLARLARWIAGRQAAAVPVAAEDFAEPTDVQPINPNTVSEPSRAA